MKTKNWYKKAQHLQNVETNDFDDREVVRAIRDAIISEHEAIKQYETVVDSTNNQRIKDVLQDIADEEKVHIGELTALLAELTDDEDYMEEGAAEIKKMANKKMSLDEIWRRQSKMFIDDKAETMLDDFIYKALRFGYSKDEIVEGLRIYYSQHPSSGEGIYERAVAKL